MKWQLIALTLCVYGMLKEFKPIEPYLFRYQKNVLNISGEDLNARVYPLWTYSYLVLLLPVLLFTDIFLYKPVLILESLSYISVWLLLIFGRSIFSQQLGQVLYGVATSTEIAYFAYIYVKVDRSKYSVVTIWTRAALQAGKCSAYIGAQLIIIYDVGDLLMLNYISLVSLSLTFVFALLLPFVSWQSAALLMKSPSALRDTSSDGRGSSHVLSSPSGDHSEWSGAKNAMSTSDTEKLRMPKSYAEYVFFRLADLRCVIVNMLSRDVTLLWWCLWWALSTCGDLQVGNFVQTLWHEAQLDVDNSKVYNGFVEGGIPLLTSLVLLAMQRLDVNWARRGEACLALGALAETLAVATMTFAHNIFVMYGGYAAYRVVYQCMITITQFNIVCLISANTCGFVFGVNMFLALLFQTVLTFMIVDSSGPLRLYVRDAFLVYTGYHGLIAAIFTLIVIVKLARQTY